MPAKTFNSFVHTISMILGIVFIYFWLHVPLLTQYSLQAFSALTLLYFLVKALNRRQENSQSKAWHFLPTYMSIETVLATMAFLLLVGATGNTSSWFYPLSYIHLFFVIFSSQIGTSIIVTLLIMLFHYGLSPDIVQHELVSLMILPIVAVFFIFAQLQHQDSVESKLLLRAEDEEIDQLTEEESELETFLSDFLEPRLQQISKLSYYPNNLELIRTQIKLIQMKLKQTLDNIHE